MTPKKSAPKKVAKKAAKPSYATREDIGALGGRIDKIVARIDNIVANLTNRLNFNPEADNNDVAFTGVGPEPVPAEEKEEGR